VRQLLEEQNIRHEVVVSLPEVAYRTNGRFNPADDLVLVADDVIMRDIFDVVHWIEDKGLRLL
jgi:hypothetical protein